LVAEVVTALPDGYPITVVSGPVDGDGIAWYKVVTDEGVQGWCDSTFLMPV
jgi:hypothetical protein